VRIKPTIEQLTARKARWEEAKSHLPLGQYEYFGEIINLLGFWPFTADPAIEGMYLTGKRLGQKTKGISVFSFRKHAKRIQ